MAAHIMVVTAGTLTLGSTPNDVSCQIISCISRDITAEIPIEVLCGTEVTAGTRTLRLDLEFLQDWRSNGISKWIADRVDTSVPFVWEPTADGTPQEAGTVKLIRRPALGGPAGQPARDSLSIPIVGGTIITPDA